MPEGVGYGPQFTASTGLSLNYIGKHALAYSGLVNVNNTETNLLDFKTGKGYIKAKVQFNGIHGSNDDFTYKIYFNGIVVQSYLVAEPSDRAKADIPLYIIIPPLTHVQCSAQNTEGSGAQSQCVALTGRVYK